MCMAVYLYLVSFFAARHWTGEGLLVSSVHAHGAQDGLGADGALCSPRLVTVRVFILDLLFITLTACGDEQLNVYFHIILYNVLYTPVRYIHEPHTPAFYTPYTIHLSHVHHILCPVPYIPYL